MTAKHFESLRIWQQARVQATAVHHSFGCKSPATRDHGFRRQIQSCAVSVMNNNAEGLERRTDEDFARFLNISKGSNGELRSMFYLAADRNRTAAEAADEMLDRAESLSAGIDNLARYLRAD